MRARAEKAKHRFARSQRPSPASGGPDRQRRPSTARSRITDAQQFLRWLLDSPRTSHYLFLMIRPASIALMTLLLGFAPGLHAAPTVLMLLEHTEEGKAVQTKIEVKSGVVESKDKGKPRAKWIIRAGKAIKSDARPGDRAVNFYKTTGGESTLLFIVKARYYQNDDGKWVPHFQLNEEPLVVRGQNGKWKPLTVIQGVPSLIAQTGTALPNAEGYVASLELGFTTGAISIDAWLVQ